MNTILAILEAGEAPYRVELDEAEGIGTPHWTVWGKHDTLDKALTDLQKAMGHGNARLTTDSGYPIFDPSRDRPW